MFFRMVVVAGFSIVLAAVPSAAQETISPEEIPTMAPEPDPDTPVSAEEILSGLKAMAPDSDSGSAVPVSADSIIKQLKNSADPCAAQADTLQDLSSVSLSINFDYNSADIGAKSYQQLKELADALDSPKLKSSKLLIAGHTDAKGSYSYNLGLSDRRADAVKAFLLTVHPTLADRVETVGCGSSLLENRDDPLAAENRRVQILNLGS